MIYFSVGTIHEGPIHIHTYIHTYIHTVHVQCLLTICFLIRLLAWKPMHSIHNVTPAIECSYKGGGTGTEFQKAQPSAGRQQK